MKEIFAKGMIDGKDIEVRCLSDKNKFSFLFNGQDNKELEEKLKDMLRQHQRIENYVQSLKNADSLTCLQKMLMCMEALNKFHTKMGSYTDGNYEKM